MVSSLLRDGRSSAVNFGEVAGIPDNYMDNVNMADFVRTEFKPAPGKKLTLVRSASFAAMSGSESYPELLPEGELRSFEFSTPSSSLSGIGNTFGGDFDKIILEGRTGSATIRKNEWTSIVLNTIRWELGETTRDESGFRLFRGLRITNLPIVEGAHPRSWDYTFDVSITREVHTLRFNRMSMAFRSANCERPLPIEERWANWLRQDPVVAIETQADNLRRLKALYIDCGEKDQFNLLYGARRFVRRLNELGIPHRYEEFPDNHSGVDYRMDESLPFLARALTG
jgi:hypothetical protein